MYASDNNYRCQGSLTSLSDQQRNQVRLLFGQNFLEFLEVGNTSPREEFKKFIVSVTWLDSVNDVLSLRPRDTADWGTSKLCDKGSVSVEAIQQMNTVHWQCTHTSSVQRTNVTELSSNICSWTRKQLEVVSIALNVLQYRQDYSEMTPTKYFST